MGYYFKFYQTFLELSRYMSDRDFGKLIKAYGEYTIQGTDTELDTYVTKTAYLLMKMISDAALDEQE